MLLLIPFDFSSPLYHNLISRFIVEIMRNLAIFSTSIATIAIRCDI
jgi:hypothetical protein